MTQVKLLDGSTVTITDYREVRLYTRIAWYLFDRTPVMVQPGYTLIDGRGEVPDPISLDGFALAIGVHLWRVRCAIAEVNDLERKAPRRFSASMRVYGRLARWIFSLPTFGPEPLVFSHDPRLPPPA